MTKVILTTKIDPTYNDLPEERYHFPKTYLRGLEQAVGDWVIYYEPRRSSGADNSRGGRQAYFATAQITSISEDPLNIDHYYAHIENYLEFDTPVPFKTNEFYYESALKKKDGSTNKGAFGRAARNIPDNEYELILQSGFAPLINQQKLDTELKPHLIPAFQEEQQEIERPIIERVVKRKFREAAFAKLVKHSYDQTCAITGVKIINGGGRAEVQAAHIKPVADNGPDSVRNGLALSGTVHWMFDRGLISINEDYTILKAKDKIPEQIERMINPDNKLYLPAHITDRPHPGFLKYHRENIFKG